MWPYWSLDCTACEAAAALVIQLFAAGLPLEEIEAAVIRLCVALQIEAEEVCVGAVTSFGPQLGTVQLCIGTKCFLHFLRSFSSESPTSRRHMHTCFIFAPVRVHPGRGRGERHPRPLLRRLRGRRLRRPGRHQRLGGEHWIVWISASQCPHLQVAVAGDKPAVEEVAGPGEGVAVARVLQLADVHVDLSYSPGSPAACGLPCCCMNSTGQAAEGEAAAGPWGEYSCDIPLRTLDTLLAAAREQELDYIIYTGDR